MWRHMTTENNAKNNKNAVYARFKSVKLKKYYKNYNFAGGPTGGGPGPWPPEPHKSGPGWRSG